MLELPGEPLAGAVGVAADVGGVVLAAEACGWQAVRAVDSISTARAEPAFHMAGDVDLIRGGSPCGVGGRRRSPLSAVAGARAALGLLPGSCRLADPVQAVLPQCSDSCNVNGAVVLVSSAPGMI